MQRSFHPLAVLLAALASAGVTELLVLFFPSLRTTWLLKQFWGGLLPVALIAALAASVCGLGISLAHRRVSWWTCVVAAIATGIGLSTIHGAEHLTPISILWHSLAYGSVGLIPWYWRFGDKASICPRCAKRRSFTEEESGDRHTKHPAGDIWDRCTTTRYKLKRTCKLCGHTWLVEVVETFDPGVG